METILILIFIFLFINMLIVAHISDTLKAINKKLDKQKEN